jgi:hypothetical protein
MRHRRLRLRTIQDCIGTVHARGVSGMITIVGAGVGEGKEDAPDLVHSYQHSYQQRSAPA